MINNTLKNNIFSLKVNNFFLIIFLLILIDKNIKNIGNNPKIKNTNTIINNLIKICKLLHPVSQDKIERKNKSISNVGQIITSQSIKNKY